MRFAAHQTRLHAGQRETAFGEVQGAARLRQRRCFGHELQIVVGQRDAGLYLCLVDGREREVELEPVVRIAGSAHLAHRLAERASQHRAGMQQLGQRPARLCIDLQQRGRVRHVGDLRFGLFDLDAGRADDAATRVAHQHAGALEHQFAGKAIERRPDDGG